MSVEKKWTPGPWRVFEKMQTDSMPVDGTDKGIGSWLHSCRQIASGERTLLGSVASDEGRKGGYPSVQSFDEMISNAHLIAAAPELYEALDAALTAICSWGELEELGINLVDVINNAYDALAKARREQA
jgi:hypothetical protein